MTSPDPRAALADELELHAAKHQGVLPTLSWEHIDIIVAALRSPSPYSGAELPVAWAQRPMVFPAGDAYISHTHVAREESDFYPFPLYLHPTTLPRDAERETIAKMILKKFLGVEDFGQSLEGWDKGCIELADAILALPPSRENPK